MPNWCLNSATFTASKEDFQKFRSLMSSGLSFEKISPTPEELMGHSVPIQDKELAQTFLQKYGETDWYNWRVKNWGTKWDLDAAEFLGCNPNWKELTDGSTEVTVSFDTAWAPPLEALKTLTTLFPSMMIDLKYFEGGMAFAGEAQFEDGCCSNLEYDHGSSGYNSLAEFFGMISEEDDAEVMA